MALGYITGKFSSKIFATNISIPLLLAASILPDIDLFLEPALKHGGPTHSVVLLITLFAPVILVWKMRSLPYLSAAASHSLIGDYLTRSVKTEGVQLLFPITSTWYSAGLEKAGLMYVYSEIILLGMFTSLLFATKDVKMLAKNHPSNWLLGIPVFTLTLPVLTGIPMHVPTELVIPHLALAALLTLPLLIDFKHLTSSFIRKSAQQTFTRVGT